MRLGLLLRHVRHPVLHRLEELRHLQRRVRHPVLHRLEELQHLEHHGLHLERHLQGERHRHRPHRGLRHQRQAPVLR